MKLYLTKGMFGANIRQIGAEFDETKTAFELIYGWKNDLANRREYRVEPYDRLVFDPDRGQVAVDFGDYSAFMLITGAGEPEMESFKGV